MKIEVNEQFYECDDNFSAKDFTGRFLLDQDLNGKVIARSNFSHETPDTKVFPENMTGVTFINCNLDNVFIPEGNIVIECSQRRFKVQNDLNDWEVDNENKPTRPFNHQILTKKGIPLPDPKNIPKQKGEKIVDLEIPQVAAEAEIITPQ